MQISLSQIPQNIIINKMLIYLLSKGERDVPEVVQNIQAGLCNGLSLLWLYHRKLGNEKFQVTVHQPRRPA